LFLLGLFERDLLSDLRFGSEFLDLERDLEEEEEERR